MSVFSYTYCSFRVFIANSVLRHKELFLDCCCKIMIINKTT